MVVVVYLVLAVCFCKRVVCSVNSVVHRSRCPVVFFGASLMFSLLWFMWYCFSDVIVVWLILLNMVFGLDWLLGCVILGCELFCCCEVGECVWLWLYCCVVVFACCVVICCLGLWFNGYVGLGVVGWCDAVVLWVALLGGVGV